jgi:signal transduction histidine kinase
VRPLPRLTFWTLHSAGWGLIGVVLFLAGWSQMPLDAALVRNGLFALYGFVVTLGFRSLYRRLWTPDPAVGRLVGAAVVLSVVAGFAAARLLNPLLIAQANLDAATLGWSVWFGGGLNFSLVFFAWSTLYLGGRYALRWQAERERALRATAHAAEARLEALHYQIRPHLLFNVLNSIAALILEKETESAYRMVLRLSDVLRRTLDRPDGGLVAVREELDDLRAYLALEAVRFNDRLDVRWAIDPAAAGCPIPSLLLQPLVENAIKHGVADRAAGGTVAIRADVDGERLRLEVADDGPGASQDDATGIGLANLRRRLETLYGEAASLRRSTDPALGGLRVQVSLPVAPPALPSRPRSDRPPPEHLSSDRPVSLS